MADEKPMRVGVEFSPEVAAKVVTIMQRMELKQPIEVIRKALSLYDFCTEMMTHHNAEIFVHYPNDTQQKIDVQ